MTAAGLVAIALAALAVTAARAHDDGQWIADHGLRNRAGAWCCGKQDCAPLAAAQFKTGPRGYLIAKTGEVIPYSEPMPFSIDGRLWICRAADGSRRCVFDRRPGS
jgi:hypothetical protein